MSSSLENPSLVSAATDRTPGVKTSFGRHSFGVQSPESKKRFKFRAGDGEQGDSGSETDLERTNEECTAAAAAPLLFREPPEVDGLFRTLGVVGDLGDAGRVTFDKGFGERP